MSKYNVIKNIAIPATTRNRARGEFAEAIDGLEVGEGFNFAFKGKLASQYAKVSPKKFPGKKFKLWEIKEGDVGFDYDVAENQFGVARLADNSTEGVTDQDGAGHEDEAE